MGLRLKNWFPNEDIIEGYFALIYRREFSFKKHRLVVEIDEKGTYWQRSRLRKERTKRPRKNWLVLY